MWAKGGCRSLQRQGSKNTISHTVIYTVVEGGAAYIGGPVRSLYVI